jgi:uncharacterized membrane protein YpjA
VILIACVTGTGYGFYYYQAQLLSTPVWLWVFVPDSPFFTMMYTVSLALYILGRRYNSFDVFAFIGLNKVGVWTLLVFLVESDYYFSPNRWSFTLVLSALHLGMILVALTLWKEMRAPSKRVVVMLAGYFVLGDVMDYGYGLHPIVPERSLGIIAAVAIFLTFASLFLTCYGLKRKG